MNREWNMTSFSIDHSQFTTSSNYIKFAE